MENLIDSQGRRIDYARISVTDRCNYRCVYCMPEDGVSTIGHDNIMRYEDIFLLCEVLEELGVRKIRFTGGEPLVRKGLVPFLIKFRETFPNLAIALTTNASLLSLHAEELAKVHLSGLNISLDTVDPRKFREITRMGEIKDVLEGIDAAIGAGIPNIKTNTVLIRDFNDDELMNIIHDTWSKGITPRLIEFMPLGDDVWNREKFISATEILAMLSHHGEWLRASSAPTEDETVFPRGPAKYYRELKSGKLVGIIEAVSDHFCSTCNRLRITADGKMKSCLFASSGTELLPFMREQDRDALKNEIVNGINLKPTKWEDLRDGKLRMSSIGG